MQLACVQDTQSPIIHNRIDLKQRLIIPPPIGGGRSIVRSVSVCVCLYVCVMSVRDHIFGPTRPIFTNFVHAACGRGSVLLWRRRDTLYTSVFTDEVISQGCWTSPPSWSAVHTQPWAWLLTVRSNTSCSLAGQRTHGTTFRAFKVTSQVATPGAESAVYDSLVDTAAKRC